MIVRCAQCRNERSMWELVKCNLCGKQNLCWACSELGHHPCKEDEDKGPCPRCGKLIAKGYSRSVFGPIICWDCLTPEERAEVK